jgi:hypothetical protein
MKPLILRRKCGATELAGTRLEALWTIVIDPTPPFARTDPVAKPTVLHNKRDGIDGGDSLFPSVGVDDCCHRALAEPANYSVSRFALGGLWMALVRRRATRATARQCPTDRSNSWDA